MRGVPWDIYIDERKGRSWSVGFLVVPNTASFSHKLFLSRHVKCADGEQRLRQREIHWNEPRGDVIEVAQSWMDTVFRHRGVKFYLLPWPRGETKELVVLRFLSVFCRHRRLTDPLNVVAIMDFDTSHANARIQNTIRETGRILRCYHLDSRNHDCLQCCDLLLGATMLLGDDPSVCLEYAGLRENRLNGVRFTDSKIKRYWAGYLGSLVDSLPPAVYDLRNLG